MFKLYLLACGVAFLVSVVMTPLSIPLARRFGALDPMSPRKIHWETKPRWGGIGIMVGFLAGLGALWFFSPTFQKILQFRRAISHRGEILFTLRLSEQLVGIVTGVVVLFILGLKDDIQGVKPGVKLLVQVLAAYMAMIYGVRIYGLSIPGFEAYSHFPLWMMQIVTIFWLIGLTNAINLIDGLDGLAAGVVAIVAGAFLAVALVQEQVLGSYLAHQMKLTGVIAAALLGSLLGFLIYNFHPAKLFMGDCGSLTLGFLVGCIAVIGTFKTTILAILIIPFLLVAVPVVDMTVVFGRRLLNKRNPFEADRLHFHHRLLDRGWTQREVVLGVYVATLVLAFISLTVVGIKK